MLTGGASSVYGSDAVSGVVNFIMDTDLEGIRLDAQYSFYQHNNERRHRHHPRRSTRAASAIRRAASPMAARSTSASRSAPASTTAAAMSSPMPATASSNAVTQGRRDYSALRLPAAHPAQVARQPAGAPGAPPSSAAVRRPRPTAPSSPNVRRPAARLGPNVEPSRSAERRWSTHVYNFAPTNYFQRPDERYTLGAFANYEISPALRPYLEVMFMDDRTVAQIAPSGDFGNTFTSIAARPARRRQLAWRRQPAALGPAARAALRRRTTCRLQTRSHRRPGHARRRARSPVRRRRCSSIRSPACLIRAASLQLLRRNVEGGGRSDDLQHTNYPHRRRHARRPLATVWSYDVYYQFGADQFRRRPI